MFQGEPDIIFSPYGTCTVGPLLSPRDEDDEHTSGRPKKRSPTFMSLSLCWLEGKELTPSGSYRPQTKKTSCDNYSTHFRPAGRRESLWLNQRGTVGDVRYHTPCTDSSKLEYSTTKKDVQNKRDTICI